MNLPKIIFRTSWLYDEALMRRKKYVYPGGIAFAKRIRYLERLWKKDGAKILREISHITKLSWHEKEIVVYLTYGVMPYSDPLTLNLKNDIDTLTHELIHRILSEPENLPRFRKGWNALMKKYRKEEQTVKVHIIIHAIHGLLLERLFGKKRLLREKIKIKNPPYLRAWALADEAGYADIVRLLIIGKKDGKKVQ